jgi:DNA-binding MarR family transcriptional regulator
MTSPTSPDALRVWFRLIRLESRIRGAIAERLRGVDLSVPQCDVLTTLSESEGVSQQDLAERLYVTKGNISGLVDRLAVAGLVERRDLPSDRRSHAIYLTPLGRKAAERGVAIQRNFVEETLGRMDMADLAAFEAHLVKARDLVRDASEKKQRAAKAAIQGAARKSGKAATSANT